MAVKGRGAPLRGVYERMYAQSTSPAMEYPVYIDSAMIGTARSGGFP